MRNAHGRIRFVDVLAARAGSPKSIDTQVRLVDLHLVYRLCLRHDGHGTGRGMDAALGLGLGHALYPMGTGFKFQVGIDIPTLYPRDNLLVATVLTRALG